jgi:hypothetical protein
VKPFPEIIIPYIDQHGHKHPPKEITKGPEFWSHLYSASTLANTIIGVLIYKQYPGSIKAYCKHEELSDEDCLLLTEMTPVKQWSEFSKFQTSFYFVAWALWMASRIENELSNTIHVYAYDYFLASGTIGFILSTGLSAIAYTSYTKCRLADEKDLFCYMGELPTMSNDYYKNDSKRSTNFAAVIILAHI